MTCFEDLALHTDKQQLKLRNEQKIKFLYLHTVQQRHVEAPRSNSYTCNQIRSQSSSDTTNPFHQSTFFDCGFFSSHFAIFEWTHAPDDFMMITTSRSNK